MRRVVVGLLVAISCGPQDPKPDPSYPEGGPRPDLCDEMCEHLRELGCPEGEPTEDGTSCEALCLEAEESDMFSMNPVCVLGLPECPMGEACSYSTE